MASTHIEIPSTASRLSADMRSLVDQARRVYAEADKVKNIADEVAQGQDWNALATKLGVSAGEAQTVYNLLTAFLAAVKAADFKAFINRLG